MVRCLGGGGGAVEEGNEAFFIRVWKTLSSRRVLKTFRESPKGKAQREQYLLDVGLGHYKTLITHFPGHLSMASLFFDCF